MQKQKRSIKYAMERFENPKVYHPYDFHRPYIFRWSGSVIPKVLPQTIFVTLLSAIVTYLTETNKLSLGIPPSFITVLGLVVSLLLAYRTNTAYDRYWEGIKTWSDMVLAIRNMTRCIWVNINVEDNEKDPVVDKRARAKHLVEKKTAINLLLGFAIAIKHYLREEPAKFDDLRPLISQPNAKSPGIQFSIGSQDNFPENDNSGTFSIKNIKRLLPMFNSRNTVDNNHNLPYEITLYLSSYIHKQKKSGTADDATVGILYANLCSLTGCLTSFEKILRSPIPLAYAIHLSQVTWLYCLGLPFQLVPELKWLTIPAIFLITLTLLGVDKIASEIENPFGWDENDLDLDDFCGLLNRELNMITSEQIPSVSDWIFTNENTPFEAGNVTALEALDLDPEEVKSLLSIPSPRQSKSDMVINITDGPLNNDESGNAPNKNTVIRME